MSPRNFARVFTREVGMTPARFVESVRVEAARRRLEESAHGVDRVAAACGFGTRRVDAPRVPAHRARAARRLSPSLPRRDAALERLIPRERRP